ncbi:DinB family protein [Actinocrispum sp. NPDC049592]|uniref:DinB family protein n=1 Tax=Actinocrispum sp. NPDC049592 TaxID=3154835 RepID=UPI00341C9CEA
MITREHYLYFTGRALNGMIEIVTGLGDDLANRRPALEGANSPYAVLHHCLGVVTYWVGWLVAGRPVDRDRGAEFEAHGPVDELVGHAREVEALLHTDVSEVDLEAPLHGFPPPEFGGPDIRLDRGVVLLHVYEELAQHHGQMEIMRDVLLAESR